MKFKKIIPLLVVGTYLTACTSYSFKPGKIENLIGTYELITYKMRHEDQMKEGDEPKDFEYDKKAEIGAKAYFSIDRDGYGFYAYKDNSTPARVDQVFTTFTYDEDKTNLIKSIKMSDGVTHKYEDQKAVGCLDEPVMGFRSEVFKKTLNYTILSGHMLFQKDRKIPYRFVEYKRISKDPSLSKVNSLMGTSVSFARPYEMKAMSGYAVYRCFPKDGAMDNKGVYEYAVLDLNSYANGELNLVYSLKDNPGRQSKKLSISVHEKGRSMKLVGLDKVFYSSSGTETPLSPGNFNTRSEDYAETDPYYDESFTLYYGTETGLEEIIRQEKMPNTPYVMHKLNGGEESYRTLSYNDLGEMYLNGLQLRENDEFAICKCGNDWLYFENYQDDGTASGKVVEGSLVEESKHYFKALEAGSYDIRVDTNYKVHITHI